MFYYPVPDTSGDGILFSIDFFLCFFVSKSTRTAGPICTKFSGKVRSEHGTTWLNFGSIRRNRAMLRCATRGRGLLCFSTTAWLNYWLITFQLTFAHHCCYISVCPVCKVDGAGIRGDDERGFSFLFGRSRISRPDLGLAMPRVYLGMRSFSSWYPRTLYIVYAGLVRTIYIAGMWRRRGTHTVHHASVSSV